VDLPALLEELRIVIEAALRDEGIDVSWDIEPGLPAVWADRQSLMQVFLNLTKNSRRAMLAQSSRHLKIVARAQGHRVTVRVQDTGGGVLDPEHLFRPFQPGAQSTGLGVYLSRALLRSFRGDLRYEPERNGAVFVVELSPAPTGNLKESYGPGNPDSVGGRSQPVPGQPQPVVAD
jgi:C4-dicarboxylate-specific signal transduction histidine kinase